MEELCILIFVSLFASNSVDIAESVKVKLEETPLKTFDEIFGEGWWDKGEAEDLKTPPPTNFGQNVHHQIDRQNTQLGQTEPNSTDQLGQIEPISTDQLGQIEPNSTDQNLTFTESNHSGQLEPNSTDQIGQIEPPNSNDQNPPLAENAEEKRKRKIVDKFHAMKDKFKQKGKFSKKEWNQIEKKIAKHLKINRKKIYKWKKELGLSRINPKNERKHLVEKFDQLKAELKRDGFKNSYKEINETVAQELGLNFKTIYKWKRELGQTAPKHKHPHCEQKELMNRYYEIKGQNPKIKDEDIAKMLKIGRSTLFRWKKQFKRQQLQPNSVDGHSVEDIAGSNV